jgi:adhesin transport system membrane fusion protein
MTSSRLDALVELHRVPNWRLTAWFVMVLLASLLIWASFMRIKEVTVASGVFVSPGGIKQIRHLEGGIIEGIHVSNGQVVNVDAPLMLIKATETGVNREELKVRLDKLFLSKARLDAEVQGINNFEYPEELAKRLPDEVILQRQKFDARRLQLDTSTSLFTQKAKVSREEVKELEAQLRAVMNNLRMGMKRFEMSKNLLNDGLTLETEHLQLEAELQNIKIQAQTLKSSVPQAKEAVANAENQIKDLNNQFRSAAREEIFKKEKAIERIQKLLDSSDEQGMRTMIRSPIDGLVKNLIYNTVGKIVRAGEPIMEIVPTEVSLIVEAKLKPADRPFVVLNQSAIVKLSAYDYVRFGTLEGRVTMVAPVASIDENGESYFKVHVQTYKSFLGDDPMLFKIAPGMLATVDIHTGEKSLMDYLIMPILQLNHKAFRER